MSGSAINRNWKQLEKLKENGKNEEFKIKQSEKQKQRRQKRKKKSMTLDKKKIF